MFALELCYRIAVW